MRKPFVAILGCGPSGLLAAYAADMAGVPFVIMSQKRKSRLGGAQYSHIPIPGITDNDPDVKLTYQVRGTAEQYQRKVYGDQRVPFVSFDKVENGKIVPAWNLPKIYDELWRMYEPRIVDMTINPLLAMRVTQGPFDAAFSTVPLPAICLSTVDMSIGHVFRSQPIVIANDTLDPNLEDNTILYDGTREHSYYRMSKIFGVGSTEWGAGSPTPPISTVTVTKPIWTNCDCHPAINRIGRFGSWEKGQLTFHAYRAMEEFCNQWTER